MRSILHFVNTLDVGGLEIFVLNLAEGLISKGYHVHIGTYERGQLEQDLLDIGVQVHYFQKKNKFDFSVPFAIKKYCRDFQIDIIHSHNYGPWMYCALAKLFGAKVQLIQTEHAINPNRRRKKVILAEKLFSFVTDQIVADCNYVKKWMVEKELLTADSVKVIFNGVNHELFCHSPVTQAEPIEKVNNKIIIGAVGRITEAKNLCLLIDSFEKALPVIEQNVELWIIGDGELKDQLMNYVENKGLKETVIFWGMRRDIPDLMRKMDVCALSSSREGFSITLLEAAASGLPIIATDVGSNSEIVQNGVSGIIVPSGDIPKMADAIMHLVMNQGVRKKMAENSRRIILERFTMKKTVNDYDAVYQSI